MSDFEKCKPSPKTTPKRTPQQKKYDRDWKLAENVFAEIFTSIQLICFTVLYMSKEDGGFDFSKKKLQNYNEFIKTHNKEFVNRTRSSKATEESYRRVGFDCAKQASSFPYIAKMKMAGKVKPGKMKIALASVDTAIETYLILAVYTLRKHYSFSWDDIRAWWSKCIEVGNLYSKGMTDEYVLQFIKNECDLEINRE